jgi:hypothetical protein
MVSSIANPHNDELGGRGHGDNSFQVASDAGANYGQIRDANEPVHTGEWQFAGLDSSIVGSVHTQNENGRLARIFPQVINDVSKSQDH